MNSLWQDVRFGFRMLRKSPGFAAVAVITLALGIGANAAIFQLIDAVRLRTLPVKDPNTLAIVHLDKHHWGQGNFSGAYSDFTFPLWQQVRDRQAAFSSVAVWGDARLNLATGGEVDFAHAIWVSGEFFQALGIQPMLGRLITSADDRTGCGGSVVLSYAFWQRRYGGSASVIGREITLEGHSFPILGVTPPSFYGVAIGDRFDVAVPVCAEPIVRPGEHSRLTGPDARQSWWLVAIGRLKPGWNLKRATAQLRVIMPAALHETIPPQYDAGGVKHYLAYQPEAIPAANGFSELRQDTATPLWLLLGLSGLVLLIACANLANLLLARGSGRGREIAVRLALGASRGQLVRQLLCESALLAIAGTVCGGFLASALSSFLVAFISTPHNPIFLDMPTDWRVLGFAAGLALLTTILFGLAPAMRAGSASPGAVLKTGGRGTTAGRDRFRLQRILVAAQVALSLVLLAGALLFARSLRNLLTRDPGFQQSGVLAAEADYTRLNLPSEGRHAFETNLLERIRAIPGVEAAVAQRWPVGESSSNDWVIGDKSNKTEETTWLDWISPGYFRTLGISMLAGRDFDQRDTAASPKVAIVNQVFVRKFLGGKDAVGKQFRLWESPGKPEPFYTVVGVVSDTVYSDMHQPFVAIAYLPRSQAEKPGTDSVYLIRSQTGMGGLLNSVKDVVAGVNPEIDIQFTVLRTQIRNSLLQDELMAMLSGFFGGLAVLLAAIGLYGTISYTVAQRTNEIGVRMALGAQRGNVLRMILVEVAALVAIGIATGTLLALALGKTASSLLFGLEPRDPVTLIVAVLILAAVAFVASLVPARRASRLEVTAALRYE
jgi:putative ABC transport system permease protein